MAESGGIAESGGVVESAAVAAAGVRSGIGRSIFWAATWALGVAAGVALGGWLTVVGGAGAPGADSLDVMQDVVALPSAAGGAVFALHLMGQASIALFRRQRRGRQTG